MRNAAFLTCILMLGTGSVRSEEPARKPRVVSLALRDTAGNERTQAQWKGRAAVVLLFLGTQCPVSNGYAPEFERLATRYGDRGVLVWGLHPDPDVTAEIARKHAAEYRLSFPILLDPDQAAARQAGVEVTPEAVVLNAAGEVLYRGRIDDRYLPGGKRREEPTTRDLVQALDAILAGKRPEVSYQKAHGCPLPAPRPAK